MSRPRRATYGPPPLRDPRREWHREIILTVGIVALLVGVLLVVGIAVTL